MKRNFRKVPIGSLQGDFFSPPGGFLIAPLTSLRNQALIFKDYPIAGKVLFRVQNVIIPD